MPYIGWIVDEVTGLFKNERIVALHPLARRQDDINFFRWVAMPRIVYSWCHQTDADPNVLARFQSTRAKNDSVGVTVIKVARYFF
tara:strand:+ start:370 stop:624 length:255 start_codon:yes stop_codon:yes gene_type:complete